jgi:hypothetical protein
VLAHVAGVLRQAPAVSSIAEEQKEDVVEMQAVNYEKNKVGQNISPIRTANF